MSKTKKILMTLKPYLFIAPAFVFLGTFTLFPILHTLYVGFFRWGVLSPEPVFIGLGNYLEAVSSPVFWQVWRNTLLYSVCTVAGTVTLGLMLALFANNDRLKGHAFFRTSLFYPHMLPWAVAAMVWMWMFQPRRGLINNLFGLKIDWLRSAVYALPALILVAIWKGTGFNFLLFLSGLQSIPREFYEAAELETNSWWHKFRYITWPMLSPTTFVVLLLAIIGSFQSVDLVYIMTQGGPANRTNVIIHYIYQQGIASWRLGYGSALSFLLFVILLALTIIYLAAMEKRVHYER
ncbi:MAG: sugar ABC transporter permease [Firmicutes bacterium]|jgi:ABC-type sugar transport system permease subunit|nr:sugar ABC transporter permease [Bacillota bacterium]